MASLAPFTVSQMHDWRRSPKIALVATSLILAVQVAIPALRLGPPDTPQRWAWQMFSKPPYSVAFTIETTQSAEVVDLETYSAHSRGDLDLTGAMPAHLCAAHPEAIRVTWEGGSLECRSG
jgi:hypothetical protein